MSKSGIGQSQSSSFLRTGDASPVSIGPGSRAFSLSGNYIMRSERDFMMVRCARINFGGVSSHGHNDALSFVLQVSSRDFFIDRGTFCYTGYPEIRNELRSTAAHNVLQVCGQEQNEFGASVFDYQGDKAEARCVEWASSEKHDVFVGEHRGFRSSSSTLICRRRIDFDKVGRSWLITDELSAGEKEQNSRAPKLSESHTLPRYSWHFHLHPEVVIQWDRHREGRLLLSSGGVDVLFEVLVGAAEVREEQSWVSYRYGSRTASRAIHIEPGIYADGTGMFKISALENRS